MWELFFPPEKRRFGWYTLPILFRDRFVGRIEPRIDRAAGRVEILGLWWEDGFAPRRAEGFVDAMRDALRAYLTFAGASRLEGRRTSPTGGCSRHDPEASAPLKAGRPCR